MSLKGLNQINFLLILTIGFLALAAWFGLPDQIPLFYSRPWGEDQLAKKEGIFLLPGISLIFFLANNFFAKQFSGQKTNFWIQANYFTSLMVNVLCLITLVKIISLV